MKFKKVIETMYITCILEFWMLVAQNSGRLLNSISDKGKRVAVRE